MFAELPVELREWIVRMRFPWLSLRDIARMWRDMDDARRIARDNIRLLAVWLCLPVWDACVSHAAFPMSGKVLRDQCGFSPAVWKALCRHGWRLFPARVMYSPAVARHIHAQTYLRLIGTDRIDGVMCADAKYGIWRMATAAPDAFRKSGDLSRAVLRHVRDELAAGQPVDCMELECKLMAIGMHLDRFQPDSNQRRAGWRWWLRQLLALDAEKRVPSRHEAWTCPAGSFVFGDIAVVPLCSTTALRSEGRRMHTCLATLADRYAQRCAKRGLQVYSLRDHSPDGPSKGTVAVALDGCGQPFVEDACGYANRSLPKRLVPALDELLRRYRDAQTQLPLAKARRQRKMERDRRKSGDTPQGRCAGCDIDSDATVSTAFATNELALAMLVRQRVRQYVTVDRQTILLVARRPGSFTIGALWPIPIHEPAMSELDGYEVAHSRRRLHDGPTCLVVPVPESINAVTVRSIVDRIEVTESPRAIIIDTTGHDAHAVAEELDALAGFLGMPIHLVSAGDSTQCSEVQPSPLPLAGEAVPQARVRGA